MIDIEEELRKKGIDAGVWKDFQAGKVTPEFVRKNKDLLGKLRELLQRQLQEDLQTLAQAKEVRDRKMFGGGE